jgi:integrase
LVNLKAPELNPNIVAELAKAWQASPQWRDLSPRTQGLWKGLTGTIVKHWGPLEVSGIEPKHVAILRDEYADTRAKANNMLRCLGAMIAWGIERGYRKDNPVHHVKQFPKGDGYPPWPWEVIEDAREALRPDLWWCVALALYTGQRLADVLVMAWTAIGTNGISVRQEKTGKLLLIPMHRDLAAIIDQIPKRAVTILTNTGSRPWTMNGWQSSWLKYKSPLVREGKFVFHGLRKSAVVTLLEAGCTDAEVAAVTGQSRAMIEHYARMVNQQRLARAAILKWEHQLNA